MPDAIGELGLLDDINELCVEYEKEFGVFPTKISAWDPSSETKKKLAADIPQLTDDDDLIDYLFSYNISEELKVGMFEKLKVGFPEISHLITPSGSASINSVANCLARLGKRGVTLLNPSYFTARYALSASGIECRNAYLTRSENSYVLTEKNIEILNSSDIIWITNPIYCTSVHYADEIKNYFESLLKNGKILIFDESDCHPGYELGRSFYKYDNFIGIYSPHKSVCINASKFSVIISSCKIQTILNHWADVLYGCLSASNRRAIIHFCSDRYDVYSENFKALIAGTKDQIASLVKPTQFGMMDPQTNGYLISVYFREIPRSLESERTFLKKMIWETGTYVIPGTRSYFDESCGFSFRLNLASDSPQYRGASARVIDFLDKEAEHHAT